MRAAGAPSWGRHGGASCQAFGCADTKSARTHTLINCICSTRRRVAGRSVYRRCLCCRVNLERNLFWPRCRESDALLLSASRRRHSDTAIPRRAITPEPLASRRHGPLDCATTCRSGAYFLLLPMEDADFADASPSSLAAADWDRRQAQAEASAHVASLSGHAYMHALDAARAAAPQAGFDLGYAAGARAGLAIGALRGLLWCVAGHASTARQARRATRTERGQPLRAAS